MAEGRDVMAGDAEVMDLRDADANRRAVTDPARLTAVRATRLLDTEAEEAFDRLTRLAVRLVGVPAAFISMVDEHRDFYKSSCGFGETLALARELSGPTFCHFAIESREPLVIPDTASDPRYRDVSTVRSLGVAAYVGIPIVIDGEAVGAFCVIDNYPRPWSAEDVQLLSELALSAQREIMLRAAERGAQETAARLRVAMDAAQMGAWSHDIGSLTRWNSAQANRLLGLGTEDAEVNVERWLSVVLPEDRARVQQAFDEAAAGEGAYNVEYRVRRDDGSVHWVCAAGMLLWSENDGSSRLVGTIEDITRRKGIELANRESDLKLRAMVEALPLLAWMNAPDGTAAYFNRLWYDYSGQDERFTQGERWMALVHPDDLQRMRALRTQAVNAREPYELELRLRRHDGTYRWHFARVAPSANSAGVVIGWAGGALDIDDRRRLETQLRESEARFRLVQDASPDGSMLLRAVRDETGTIMDFRVVYANASAHRILLDAPEERLTDRLVTEAFPESGARFAMYVQVVETGEPWQHDVYYARSERQRGLRLTVVRSDDGVHIAFADLSERLEAAAERDRMLAAERAARADADRARGEAEQANAVKSQFLATMSHELRTPLNAIGGYAQLIELGVHGPVTAAQCDALDRIQRSQKHLLGLINEVLNYAKIEAGAVSFHITDVPALEIARGVEALVAPQARQKEIALTVNAEPGLLVHADVEKARQVLLNLLSNAVKFTARGGRVSLECAALDASAGRLPMVEFRVRDTGRGIRPDHLERVFAPFVQVGRELTSDQSGTGLGLAISRDLARGMGGEITATSTEGVGSLFVLTLPRA